MKMTTFSVLILLVCVSWTIAVPDRIKEEGKDPSPPPITEEGLARTAEEIQKDEEIPPGCSVSLDETDTSYGSLRCEASEENLADVQFNEMTNIWYWHDGGCCCPAYRWLSCPKTIWVKGIEYDVVQFPSGAQCWTEASCKMRGLCPTECKPRYTSVTVLVYHNFGFRFVHYYYVSSCRCTTCNGGYCWKNENGISLLD